MKQMPGICAGILNYGKACCNGVSQVMLQESVLIGVCFIAGLLVGCLGLGGEGHMDVFVDALVALGLATLISGNSRNGDKAKGLFGFNAVLVGCAASTLLCVWLPTWIYLFGVAVTLPLKLMLDKAVVRIGASSLTLPFIIATWIVLYLADLKGVASYAPESIAEEPVVSVLTVLSGWMKGLSQVFLINSWITGVLFFIGLWIASRQAALWALCGSAIGMACAAVCGCRWVEIADGLWGFSPVLTAIAIGVTFRPTDATWRWVAVVVTAVVFTFILQWTLTPILAMASLPVLTLPFCLATWVIVSLIHKC